MPTKKLTLVVFSETDHYENAYNNAEGVASEHILPNTDYYRVKRISHPDDPQKPYAVPLHSQDGQELLDDALERTRDAQLNVLSDLVDKLNHVQDYDNLLEDDDFRSDCWRLGADNSPIFSFYDGTGYHRGTPIHSQDTVDEIEQSASRPLYVAVVALD